MASLSLLDSNGTHQVPVMPYQQSWQGRVPVGLADATVMTRMLSHMMRPNALCSLAKWTTPRETRAFACGTKW